MNKPNRAFIFDMDGVLIDSERSWVRYDADFLTKVFGKEISGKIGKTIGLTVNTVYEKAVSFGTTVDKNKLIEIYDNQAHSIYSQSEITEDIDNLVAELDKLNFKLGLVSSSRQNWIDKVLPRLAFREKLEHIISVNDRPDLKPKPAPDGYLEAIKELGAIPQTTIILEDSNTGIKAAKASGAYVIGFRKNLVDGYEQEGADVYANDVHEVVDMVKKLSGNFG
jgi:HAD superfamily hydrolase (TIGR01509 family)